MTDPRSGSSGTTPQTGTAGYTRGGEALSPERRARLAIEAFNQRDLDMALEQSAPDVEIVDQATGEHFKGHEGSRRFMQQWIDAFPDAKCVVSNVIGAGDTVVMEYRGQGTNTGSLRTPQGAIPPTGKYVDLPMCDVLEFKDGRLARQRTYYDGGSLMLQLGLRG